MNAGVTALYVDDEPSMVATAEGGLPEAGWNTFGAHEEGGVTVARV